MSQGKTSSKSSRSELESTSQFSSYTSSDLYSDTCSTYGTGSEPDYIMLEIRIKQQADDIGHLQRQNRRLVEDLDLERSEGMKRLKKLEAAAKIAEKRTQELSVELERSRESVQQYQELYDAQENQMLEAAANKEVQDDRPRVEAKIQQLEADIVQAKEDIKNGNYESTQQRAAIRKALEERCIAQRLLEASEKERRDLEKKLAELERLNRQQEAAMKGAAQGWLKKNHEIEVQREEIRWRMVDAKSGLVGSHISKKQQKDAQQSSAQQAATAGSSNKLTRRPKTALSSTSSSASGSSHHRPDAGKKK